MNRLVVSFLLSLTAPAAAQGLLIGPADGGRDATSSTTSQPRRPGVHIVGTKIHADIVDGVATTTIDQTIRNTTQRIAEGTWFLPLPAGAVADGARRRCRRALAQADDFGLIEIGPGNCVDEVELRVERDAVGVVVQSGRRVASHLAGVEQDALVAASCSTVWG